MKAAKFADWTGAVVGHWLIDSHMRSRKAGRKTYRCISKCGVVYPLTSSELVMGGPLSCEACRELKARHVRSLLGMQHVLGVGKAAPPLSRIVDEAELERHQTRWLRENVVKIETRSLKAQGTITEWEKYGKPFLTDIIERTGLGLEFGWNVSVMDVVSYGRSIKKPQKRKARIFGEKIEVHGVDVRIYPADHGCLHAFEVRIHSARTGVFRDTIEKLRHACEQLSGGSIEADEKPDPAPAAAVAEVMGTANGKHPAPFTAPPPAAVAAKLGDGVDRLEKMRTGLDTVIAIAKEAKAGAAMRAEIQAKVDALRARANPLAARAEQTAKTHKAAEARLVETGKALAEARKLLKEAEEENAWAIKNELDTRLEAAGANVEALPVMEELQKELAELDAADRIEAERVKALGDAPQLAGLLAALEKMGG